MTGNSGSWTSWDDYFSNTDSSNCPITECSLYESDCSTGFSGDVFIDSSTPLLVEMLRNQINGYSHSLCVKCTNGAQTVEKNGWDVSLIGC